MLVCAALLLAVPSARADEEPARRADALFDAGKRLLDAGSVAEACRAFADSYALDPTGGTLLNLGVCLEKQGKLASAAATLERALARAHEDQRTDRAEVAQNHLEAVRPRLSFVMLARAKNLGKGPVSVEIDGEPWLEESWAVPRALDAGDHTISYGEPGVPKRTAVVTIATEGETRTVTLEPAPSKTKPNITQPQPRSDANGAPGWLLPTGIAVTAAGGIGLAIGIGFGVEAINIDAEVSSRCPEVACDDPSVVALNEDFDRAATASTAGFVAGGVLAAVGVGGLIATAVLDRPKEASSTALRIGPGFVSLESRW